MKTKLTSIFAAALLASGATLAFADEPSAPAQSEQPPAQMNKDMMQGMGGGMGKGMGMGMHMGKGMAECAAASDRLATLKGDLAITDAQTAAWDEYTNAVKSRMDVMKSNRAGMMKAMNDGGGLIQRLDARITAMQAMLKSMTSLKAAAEKLYGALDADQKKKADTLLGTGCMM
ncbi:MAG: Spy/CpxP family protein refolding chaperone [Hyphomicrobiaceae bacterium]|nr:Spy/CpxP family protein refolding chaperone [Hyphomicrobiaceae bacterium]